MCPWVCICGRSHEARQPAHSSTEGCAGGQGVKQDSGSVKCKHCPSLMAMAWAEGAGQGGIEAAKAQLRALASSKAPPRSSRSCCAALQARQARLLHVRRPVAQIQLAATSRDEQAHGESTTSAAFDAGPTPAQSAGLSGKHVKVRSFLSAPPSSVRGARGMASMGSELGVVGSRAKPPRLSRLQQRSADLSPVARTEEYRCLVWIW